MIGFLYVTAAMLLIGIATGRITNTRGGMHVCAALVFVFLILLLIRFGG